MMGDGGVMCPRTGTDDEFLKRCCARPLSWPIEVLPETILDAGSKHNCAKLCGLCAKGMKDARVEGGTGNMSEGLDIDAAAGQETIKHIINEVVATFSFVMAWHLGHVDASLFDPEL